MPTIEVTELVDGIPQPVSITKIFERKKRAVLFAVPGAFTPGCSKTHLPGYISDSSALKEAGVDAIACLSVNDPFVMDAWGKQHGADKAGIRMLADPAGKLAEAIGTLFDAKAVLGNMRCRRFSMIIEDNKVVAFNLEQSGEMACSLSNQLFDQLKKL
jgi:2-Cys peroxiredoxin 5